MRILDSSTNFGWLVVGGKGVCMHILDSSSLIYLFWAVLGLCCCEGFSLIAPSGDYPLGTRVSHCCSFSSCGAQAVGRQDFSNCGARA